MRVYIKDYNTQGVGVRGAQILGVKILLLILRVGCIGAGKQLSNEAK